MVDCSNNGCLDILSGYKQYCYSRQTSNDGCLCIISGVAGRIGSLQTNHSGDNGLQKGVALHMASSQYEFSSGSKFADDVPMMADLRCKLQGDVI